MEPQSGVDLFRKQEYYEAHESWESAWRKLAPGPAKERLQAWIMIAGIGVHLQGGRLPPVSRMAERAMELLGPFDEPARRSLERFSRSPLPSTKDCLVQLGLLIPPSDL